MANRLLPFGESLKPPAVHEKDVEPSIVIVVVESDAAAGGLEKIFVLVFPAKDGLGVQPGLPSDIHKSHAQWGAIRFFCGGRDRFRLWSCRSKDLLSSQNQRGTAKRLQECAASEHWKIDLTTGSLASRKIEVFRWRLLCGISLRCVFPNQFVVKHSGRYALELRTEPWKCAEARTPCIGLFWNWRCRCLR